MTAMSHLAGVLIGEEANWAEEVARTLAIAALSESIQSDEGFYHSGAMRNDPTVQVGVPGLKSVSGGISLEPNANDLGRILRGTFGARSSDLLEGQPTNPAATPIAGGTLQDGGTYRYKICTVVSHDVTGEWSCLNPSDEVSATPAGTNLSVDVNWTPPAEVPDRTSGEGFLVFRTEPDGVSGSQQLIQWVNGFATNQWTDDGSAILIPEVTPPPAVTRHSYSRGTASSTLASFSVEVLKNNGSAELMVGARWNSISLGLQAEGQMTFDLDTLCQDRTELDSPTVPSFAVSAGPFMGHRSVVYAGPAGAPPAHFTLSTQVTVDVANNLNGRRYLNNTRTLSAIKTGRQEVTGQFLADYDTADLLVDVVGIVPQALRTETSANGVASWSHVLGSGEVIRPWRYQVGLYLPLADLTSHQGNASGQDPIVQTVAFTARKDATAGFPIEVTVDNITASYS